MSVGEEHACAVLDDQSLVCFGRSYYGNTGHGLAGKIGDDEVRDLSKWNHALTVFYLG